MTRSGLLRDAPIIARSGQSTVGAGRIHSSPKFAQGIGLRDGRATHILAAWRAKIVQIAVVRAGGWSTSRGSKGGSRRLKRQKEPRVMGTHRAAVQPRVPIVPTRITSTRTGRKRCGPFRAIAPRATAIRGY